MTRRIGSSTLVIATHNAGKLKEISALLEPYGVKCISAGSLGLPEPAETGTTFVQNALLKARAAAEASHLTWPPRRALLRRLTSGAEGSRRVSRETLPRSTPTSAPQAWGASGSG